MRRFKLPHGHLAPGGLFLFDVWHGPAVLSQRPSERIKEVADDRYRVKRTARPELDTNSSTVKVVYEMECEDRSCGEMVQVQRRAPDAISVSHGGGTARAELRDAAESYRRVSHRPAAFSIHLGRRLSLAALRVCSCLIFLSDYELVIRPTRGWLQPEFDVMSGAIATFCFCWCIATSSPNISRRSLGPRGLFSSLYSRRSSLR